MVEPIACALEQPQLQHRMRAWGDLRWSGIEPTPAGVRVDFAPDVAVAHRLLDLVAAERECCRWADWTITSSSRVTRLDVVADGAGADVLHTMFGVER